MTLPPRGPLNSGQVDHTTDTWDTIDWLIKNVPGNNGKVGITGVSYDGFLTLAGADRSPSGARRRGADERDGRGLDRRRLVPQRRVPPDHDRVRLRADHRQGGRPQAPVRLPRPLPGVPRRRLGRRVRPQGRSRSPAGLAPVGGASRLHRLLEATGGRPGAAEGDALGARRSTCTACSIRRTSTARSSRTPRSSEGTASATTSCSDRGITASRPARRRRSDHSSGAPTPASTSAPRCCSHSGTSTSRVCRPRRSAPGRCWRSIPATIAGGSSTPGRPGGDRAPQALSAAVGRPRLHRASQRRRPTPPLRSSPIPPSRCPIACRRSGRCGPRTRRGVAGWSTTSDRSPVAPTSWCSRASR